MKVKCINNKQGFWSTRIAIGKIYEVIGEDERRYTIINEKGNIDWFYPKDWFRLLSDIRNEKINKLLEDES